LIDKSNAACRSVDIKVQSDDLYTAGMSGPNHWRPSGLIREEVTDPQVLEVRVEFPELAGRVDRSGGRHSGDRQKGDGHFGTIWQHDRDTRPISHPGGAQRSGSFQDVTPQPLVDKRRTPGCDQGWRVRRRLCVPFDEVVDSAGDHAERWPSRPILALRRSRAASVDCSGVIS
jgi:hypothetical protein